ncbi:3-mercaptopyruvate sulfurtransferase [Fukomys damarensis]|uniref:3-mercaptopyruvate sulfurtransferase n=1 Tax=Fukomys damarensis TaxID=885580 RepID=A0A091DMM0_FUKDA|nr:3-mercaptopyruvate sulfurtransferase [Fukomys damarensis]
MTVANERIFKLKQEPPYEDIKSILESRRFQVEDAWTASHFLGTDHEPGDSIEIGHIPGTVNVPFTEFLTEEGKEKSPEEICCFRRRRWTCPGPRWPHVAAVSRPATWCWGPTSAVSPTCPSKMAPGSSGTCVPSLNTSSPRAEGKPTEVGGDTGDTRPTAAHSLDL